MTSRFKFLASLLGIAGVVRAQQRYQAYMEPDWKQCDVPGNEVGRVADPLTGCGGRMQMKQVKNNQCPVCGTMAKPYKFNGVDCGGAIGKLGINDSCSAINLTRCARCNNAFWQEAEK